ncbi:MAG: SAM-dependent methyltransferase [SAR324 cluster bacterium]|nr:SAM-dependent methyltransferase [SAR324 cluster bacterium]
MGLKLKDLRPWGRNLKEYYKMFNLKTLPDRVLDVASGPAAFNFQARLLGYKVTSLDPIYDLKKSEIEQSIAQSQEEIGKGIRDSQDEFIWEQYPSPEALIHTRLQAMGEFLKDFEEGKKEGHYVAGSALSLPFTDHSFGLCLSSHFLFLYSEQLDFDFHTKAIAEMMRVAKETRIYPLIDLVGKQSRHLDKVIIHLKAQGFKAELKPTDYRFQRGATEYLSISH